MRKISTWALAFTLGATLVLTGWGCAPKSAEQTAAEAFETMSDAIASGKSVKCTVSSSDGAETMEAVYWIKGEDMRGEMKFDGQQSVFVQKDGVMYTSAEMFGAADCDWLSMDMTAEGEEPEAVLGDDYQDFDYEQYEDNAMYQVQCERAMFGNEKFEIKGKVCSMEEIFSAMMGGIEIDY